MLEFRADEKTAEKLTEIADTLDISRSDLLLSMVKFALTNHQWARFGLTHKTLPRYEENPIMATKKFSPAQIAAQKLFAERARAGTLGKGTKRKANPAKKTVSGKISQLVHEGYPQKQAIAIALSEQRAGKVKRNPISDAGEFVMTVNGKSKTRFFVTDDNQWASSYGFDYRLLSDVTKYGSPVKFTKTRAIVAIDEGADGKPITETWSIRGLKFYKTNPDKAKPRAYVKRASQATGAPPSKRLVTRRKKALTAPAGYFPNPEPSHDFARIGKPFAFDGRTWKVSQYSHNGKTIEAYTTDRKKFIRREFDVSELMTTRRKANPTAAMMTAYQVICMHPKQHVVGIFKTMAEAKQIATAMANAKGVAYGVKTVKVHKAHFAA